MVCTNHQDTTTALIARIICSLKSVFECPFVDFSKKTIATKLTSDAPKTKRNIIIRLESCILANNLTSRGCDDNIMIQSNIIIIEAKLIQVNNISAGKEKELRIKKNTIMLTHKDIIKR